jgi:flagellar biosynthetic protein FliR
MDLHFEQIMTAALFVGARIGSLMMFSPFLGSEAITLPIKAGLTVLLTGLLYPGYGPLGIQLDALGWLRVMGGEIVAGLLLGLAMQLVFEAAQFGGQIAGVQTGFSLITILDPQTQADTPVLAIFQQLIVLLIFFQLNVHHWMLRGLAASFAYLPPGKVIASLGATMELLRAAGAIWLAGLQIAAPVLVSTLLADIAMGFVARAAPQLPVVFVGLSLKNILGLAILGSSFALWPRIFERHFSAAIGLGERLLHLAR